jgi:WD40 repeat protein
VFVAVLLCAVLLCAWIIFIGSKNPPIDHKVSSVALSSTGRWLAAGTSQGRITVWDQTRPDAPKQIVFPHGSLNGLQFSPDEHALAIASEDLGMYAPAESAAPQLLRSDHGNYGSVRFSRDGQTLLVISAASLVETIDVHSGALRLRICCSSFYGEAVFTPDGQTIANSGHWPSLWDARSGQLIGRLTASREFATFRPIAFDAIRDAVLMGSQDGRVYAWNLRTRQPMAVSPPQPAYVDALAISRNGWVIFAGLGNAVQFWNPDSGQRRSLPAARPTSNLVLGPDGASIIFGSADGTVEFWDLRTTSSRQEDSGAIRRWVTFAGRCMRERRLTRRRRTSVCPRNNSKPRYRASKS